MTSPLNPDPTLSSAHASSSSGPPTVNHSASHPYSPSVPISVYRELSAELSSTRIQMETYKFQNQQLVEQNQKLRLEIERVVQSTLYLRQVADGYNAVRGAIDDAPSPIAPPVARTTPKPQRPASKRSQAAAPLFTEQPEIQGQRGRDRLPKEINGWWLTVIIGVIVITAFGTGFLLVRPLLPSR